MGQTCATETKQTFQEGGFSPCGIDCDSNCLRERGCLGAEAQPVTLRPMPPPAMPVSPEADTGAPVGMWSPRNQKLNEDTGVKEPLTAAVEESRYCAAEKEFSRLVQTQKLDPESHVSRSCFQIEDVDIERFSRIAKTMGRAVEMSTDMPPGSFDICERNRSLNLCWGLKVVGEKMLGSFNCTVPLNILECCVVEFERDLENVHSLEEIKAEFLRGLPDDAVWRRQSRDKETGFLGDDIEIVSVCDALDEHGCIMRMKYLPDDLKFPYGVQPSDYGLETSATRSDGQCSFVKLVPTVEGTEVHSVFEVVLPEAVANVLRSAEASVLKAGSRNAYETWVASVVPWANAEHGKAEITRRLNRAPLSRVYKHLESHIFRLYPGHVQGFPFPK